MSFAHTPGQKTGSCWRIIAVFVGAVTMAGAAPARAEETGEDPASAAQLRRPIAACLTADEQRLYVANRCGTISVIDLASQQLQCETAVGAQLSDLEWLDKQNQYLLATDERLHELILLAALDATPRIVARIAVSPYPVAVVADAQGDACYVTSLWSRRVSRIAVQPDAATLNVQQVLDLPVAPREMIADAGGQQLIIADAFAGRLLVVDRQPLALRFTRTFAGHNVRGLAQNPDGKLLIVGHQMLNDLAHTVRNDVHWGLLMSNDLRWLRMESLLDPQRNLYDGGHMHPLGEAGNAAGDPGGVAITADGQVVVCLSGVDEIATGRENDFSLFRIAVGKRPTQVIVTSSGRQAYVVNTFGDSISVVDLHARKATAEISLGRQRELSLAEKGELLFYSASLSHDSWMSCHSCHTDGHTTGGLNDNFSDASFGAPKRILSLLGAHSTAPFAWNGNVAELQEQIRNSVSQTMQSDKELSPAKLEALMAFLQTLEPPPSIDRLRGQEDPPAIERGGQLFAALNCTQCHAPPLYTTPDVYDVGLDDGQGNRQFNPPSLRGVGQREPLFHDNRAAQLEDVFRQHGHQLPRDLMDDELRDLLAFLRSL